MYRILVVCSLAWVVGGDSLPVVTIAQGKVRGKIANSLSGREYYAFNGIPYAEPPVGRNRFMPPIPKKPWKGVLIADAKPIECLQLNFMTFGTPNPVTGTEDCLYINVFTPKLPGTRNFKPMDVLLWIHGGGFEWMSSTTNSPDYILDRDIVHVSFNYRLSTLGFLLLDYDKVPGNNGLKDQVMAIKWVKENIAKFGGDPNKITLAGMSAGAACVEYHMVSKQTKGLFQKAIMVSGTNICPWSISTKVREKSLALANELGCLPGTTDEILQCMQDRPARVLVEKITLLKGFSYFQLALIGPTIEKPGPNAFIEKHPFLATKDGDSSHIPKLYTFNTGEGLFPGSGIIADETGWFDTHWNDFLPHVLHFNYTTDKEQRIDIVQKVKQHYMGNSSIREKPADFTRIISDRLFYGGIFQTMALHSQLYKGPVWAYRFSAVLDQNPTDFQVKGLFEGGTYHALDSCFVFKCDFWAVDPLENSKPFIKTLIDIWMDFIQGTIDPSWKQVKTALPDIAFKDVKSSNPAENVMMTISRSTPGLKLWQSFGIRENELADPPEWKK